MSWKLAGLRTWRNPISIFLAFWFFAYFLLPSSLWARLSFGALLTHWVEEAFPITPHKFQWFSAIFLALATIAVVVFVQRKEALNKSIALVVLVCMYVAAFLPPLILSSPDTTQVQTACSTLIAFCTGLICTLLLRRAKIGVFLLCLFGLIQGLFVIYYAKMGVHYVISGSISRAGGTFTDPSSVCTLMLLGLPLAMSQVLFGNKYSKSSLQEQGFWVVTISVMFAALVLTWERGGALALSIALLWLFNQFAGEWRVRIFVSLIAILIPVVVCGHRNFGDISSASAQRSTSGHYLLWKDGAKLFQDNWLTGVGVNAVLIETITPTQDPGVMVSQANPDPKNLFLYWLDEFGISGGVLFIGFLLAVPYSITHVLKVVSDKSVAMGVFASWIALFVAGIFDTPFGVAERSCGNLLVGILVGITVLLPAQTHGKILNTQSSKLHLV